MKLLRSKKISFKVIGKKENVIGKVIVFSDSGYAIEERIRDDTTGQIYKRLLDHFDISQSQKIKTYRKAFNREIMKHVSPNTTIVYIDENVENFLKRL